MKEAENPEGLNIEKKTELLLKKTQPTHPPKQTINVKKSFFLEGNHFKVGIFPISIAGRIGTKL